MLFFESDYMEGCHPKILERLVETNFTSVSGYGHDDFTENAKKKISAACGCPGAQIQFITGGTQTNQLVIATMLKLYEGVVAASSGHVNTHEAGAIEYTGHKVLTVPSHEGKMKSNELNDFLELFYKDGNNEHEIFPGLVYISQPTEYGTLYSKQELTDLSETCHKYSIPLYMDGARLGYALTSSENDVSLKDIAALCDAFYIGGTKCGALCGEALIFTKNNMPLHFENLVKKHGALLAKGRLNAIQFDTLFTDNLYTEICASANRLAEKLKEGFRTKGYSFLLDSPTNQQFIVLENNKMETLKDKVKFSFWETVDQNHTAVRFATSWATKEENVDRLLELI